ncbi:lipoprotein signal peptidase [Neisseria dumasiana]|uniref:Lipoprotein signal peptidase n=1 Tax=Neisseria dumasiana TaxID=1931275 RepID=A0A1X3DI89_9NEIS|nr:lipoprotein signal peptidase [Neisseria dumasiana]OSI22015.1 lipoprotein signal peptidase [Neisseria dumasiana]
MQNSHLRRISALCAARSFAYQYDMSALVVLPRLELHPHLRGLQRSQPVFYPARFQVYNEFGLRSRF